MQRNYAINNNDSHNYIVYDLVGADFVTMQDEQFMITNPILYHKLSINDRNLPLQANSYKNGDSIC